jgi:XTP/dITP diphosphohydrolase
MDGLPAQVVLASGNAGKWREMAEIFRALDVTLRPQSDFKLKEARETGTTFVENAIIKARHAAAATGLAAVADDSGIVVDALRGAPGIYSARYAGERATDAENLDRLLADTSHLAEGQRGCAFVCVVVLLAHAEDPIPVIGQGVWRGELAFEPRGTNGFGYDPIFFLRDRNCTSAELMPEVKNQLSHRGQAVRELLQRLRERYGV